MNLKSAVWVLVIASLLQLSHQNYNNYINPYNLQYRNDFGRNDNRYLYNDRYSSYGGLDNSMYRYLDNIDLFEYPQYDNIYGQPLKNYYNYNLGPTSAYPDYYDDYVATQGSAYSSILEGPQNLIYDRRFTPNNYYETPQTTLNWYNFPPMLPTTHYGPEYYADIESNLFDYTSMYDSIQLPNYAYSPYSYEKPEIPFTNYIQTPQESFYGYDYGLYTHPRYEYTPDVNEYASIYPYAQEYYPNVRDTISDYFNMFGNTNSPVPVTYADSQYTPYRFNQPRSQLQFDVPEEYLGFRNGARTSYEYPYLYTETFYPQEYASINENVEMYVSDFLESREEELFEPFLNQEIPLFRIPEYQSDIEYDYAPTTSYTSESEISFRDKLRIYANKFLAHKDEFSLPTLGGENAYIGYNPRNILNRYQIPASYVNAESDIYTWDAIEEVDEIVVFEEFLECDEFDEFEDYQPIIYSQLPAFIVEAVIPPRTVVENFLQKDDIYDIYAFDALTVDTSYLLNPNADIFEEIRFMQEEENFVEYVGKYDLYYDELLCRYVLFDVVEGVEVIIFGENVVPEIDEYYMYATDENIIIENISNTIGGFDEPGFDYGYSWYEDNGCDSPDGVIKQRSKRNTPEDDTPNYVTLIDFIFFNYIRTGILAMKKAHIMKKNGGSYTELAYAALDAVKRSELYQTLRFDESDDNGIISTFNNVIWWSQPVNIEGDENTLLFDLILEYMFRIAFTWLCQNNKIKTNFDIETLVKKAVELLRMESIYPFVFAETEDESDAKILLSTPNWWHLFGNMVTIDNYKRWDYIE